MKQDLLKKVINENIDYSLVISELIYDVIDRIDDINNDDELIDSINDTIIYYDDQWDIMRHYFYGEPEKANFNDAMDEFYNDCYKCLCAYREALNG